ncbi:MAG: 1-acyl-sn-glycerol-3-phosphate acyltransferase [Alistipes sp.]|nr:1-acyl-sn-glycerol-3-phosphate acyltransferase [Alistipes sp.]
MAREKKIQDPDWLYSFLRHYVDFLVRMSYRDLRYVDRNRVPKDGAVIYAPNHTGTLMDAMMLLAMDSSPKVFVARADLFKNPTLKKIFTFLKIMPIMRMRDGIDEVKRNNETIERAVEVLRDKVPFVIFPEGMHQTKYSSLPLSKGIFRIAFQAHDLMPDTPLYIVPVGIRYGSFFRYRSTARVQMGEPINVGEFIAEHSESTPQEQMNIMREHLESRLRDAIFYIPNDEDYEATYEICAAVVARQRLHLKSDPEYRNMRGMDIYFAANNMTVKHLDYLKQANEPLAQRLLELGHEASEMRQKENITLKSVAVRYPIMSRILKLFIYILTLPYTAFASVAALPTTLLGGFIFKKFKDQAFRNSVRFMLNLVVWPVVMILYSIVAYIALPWQWALPLTLLLLPSPYVADESYRLVRLMVSDYKLWRNKKLRAKYKEIRNLMFNK